MKKNLLLFLIGCFFGINFLYSEEQIDFVSNIKQSLIDSFLIKIDDIKNDLDLSILQEIQTQFATFLNSDQIAKLNKIVSDKQASGQTTGTGDIANQISLIKDKLQELQRQKESVDEELRLCNLKLSTPAPIGSSLLDSTLINNLKNTVNNLLTQASNIGVKFDNFIQNKENLNSSLNNLESRVINLENKS